MPTPNHSPRPPSEGKWLTPYRRKGGRKNGAKEERKEGKNEGRNEDITF